MSGAATLAPGTAATPCTLNRTGLGTPQTAQVHRCKKIVAHDEHIDNLLVDLVMDRNYKAPEQPALTVDTTDSVGHGSEEPSYRERCHLPLDCVRDVSVQHACLRGSS